MANTYNFRSGHMKLVQCAVDSATVIEKGDLLFLDTDDVKPAADQSWNSDLATTQADFADVFIGIANAPSASGDTDDLDVDVSASSVYEYTVASATYEVGDPLGPDKAAGNALLSQTLEAAVAASSVAMAQERKASASTRLRVSFASAYNPASSNANAVIG